MMAEDIQKLVEQFYPAPERLSPGWMVFTHLSPSDIFSRAKAQHSARRLVQVEVVSLLISHADEMKTMK